MKNKSIWGVLLSLVVTVAVLTVFGGIAVSADPAVVNSGSCGDNVTYTLYSDGLMEITGTGAMTDYSYGAAVPWYDYKADITSVTISSGITHIGANSFNYYYTNIETVSIPDSVTSIGQYAFYYCINLTTADLSDNITEIGDYAFYYCQKLKIPNFPHNIQTIGEAAFQCCLELTELTIPDSVTSIGNRAFSTCQNMETLNFPAAENLKFDTIPSGCFNDCISLTTVTIPSGIEHLDSYAFKSCELLSSVDIPASVYEIGSGAFAFCSSLKELPLTNNVTTIGGEAFSHSGLTSFTIPDSITKIPNYCFRDCPDLVSVDIPDSVLEFGYSSFEGCTSLKSIVIPDSITIIPEFAFCGCTSLESVTIPDSITTIGNSAFTNCTSLTNLVIPDSVRSIGQLAFQETNTKSITLPGSLETVTGYAFQNNEYLESVTFGDGIEEIEYCAFNGCNNIKTVIIPSTVRHVGDYALGSGENMTDIYLYADPICLNVFSSVGNYNENTKIHVSSYYLSDYKTYYWYISDLFVGDAEGGISLGSSTHLCGYTLSMDGNIGVNFYMLLGDNVLNNASTAYMQFTVNGKTQKVKISDAKRDGTYYIFRCDTVAKEMTDTISAQVFISEGNPDGDAYTYSVRDYAIYILGHQDDFGAKTVAVVKAMLNYGASAQKFFGYKTDDLANSILSDVDRKIAPVDPASMSFTPSSKKVYADIILTKVSLSLKSEITMKLYFSGDTSGVDFYVGTTKLKTTTSGSYTIVTINGIYAQNIGTGITVDAYAGDSYLGSATCAPMRYCYLALTSNDAAVTPELKEVVSALYYYNQALIKYAG